LSLDGLNAGLGSATDAQGRTAPYLALIGSDGTSAQIIQTSPYHPRKVALTPDGFVWTVGFQPKTGGRPSDPDPEANVIRRWDRKGNPAGGWLPQSSLADPFRTLAFESALAASSYGVSWYSPFASLLAEVSPAGH
jgi:hypothetical protein